MFSVLPIVLPIFALILAGGMARRMGALGPHATGEINRFVVYLALPALLFDIVAHASWDSLWQPGFVASFGLGVAVVFSATVVLRWRRGQHLADAAIDGLNAAYANTGFIGIPLVLALMGREALVPALITTIITVCVLFAVAIVVIEAAVQVRQHPVRMLIKVGRQLVRNPLLIAPAAGLAVMLAGWTVPAPVDVFLKLLGGAASPCALIALGLFLAERRPASGSCQNEAALLVALKLVAQPVLTWLLAVYVFDLATPLVHIAVLLAALPTGTGPFMMAQFYQRDAALTSTVILASTILSLATITGYLMLAL